MVTLPPRLVSTDFGTCSYQCFLPSCTHVSLHMLKCSWAHTLSCLRVYWDQPDANCLVLFYYTFFTLHVSDVKYIHPQERHIMHMQSDTGKCTCELTRSTPCLASISNIWKPETAWNGSTHTCTYLYQTACALYDAPEDGCILHPKHVE